MTLMPNNPPGPDWTPNIDKAVVSKSGLDIYITNVYTGSGNTANKPTRVVPVSFLNREKFMDGYERAVDLATVQSKTEIP